MDPSSESVRGVVCLTIALNKTKSVYEELRARRLPTGIGDTTIQSEIWADDLEEEVQQKHNDDKGGWIEVGGRRKKVSQQRQRQAPMVRPHHNKGPTTSYFVDKLPLDCSRAMLVEEFTKFVDITEVFITKKKDKRKHVLVVSGAQDAMRLNPKKPTFTTCRGSHRPPAFQISPIPIQIEESYTGKYFL
ncbi:hypothetical protein QVD17_41885 [Tagetes erecta]|uniref:Uncharacterized protein n=1 Tax=Tagetes erecta TaxID=13708 RepID=A0AAD8JL41_TARER|nr:hypothetical protein QVD17_41885 [Tagetes erecta]